MATDTPIIGLKRPDYTSIRWDLPMNYNSDLLDVEIGAIQAALAESTPSSEVSMPETPSGGSWCNTLQCFIDKTHSNGFFEGATITDNGDGSVTVSESLGYIRAINNPLAELNAFKCFNSGAVVVPDMTESYVVIKYNAGSPAYQISTTKPNTITYDQIIIGRVYRQGVVCHVIHSGEDMTDIPNRIQNRLNLTHGDIVRADALGGLILGDVGTRNITVTAGTIFSGLTPETFPSIDTSTGGTFTIYNSAASGMPDSTAQTQWPNTQYWTGSALATLTTGRYGALFFYLDFDGDLIMQYGDVNSTSVAVAETSPVPLPPDIAADFSLYLGRLVFKNGDATASAVTSAFDKPEGGSLVTSHTELADVLGSGVNHLSDGLHTQLVNGSLSANSINFGETNWYATIGGTADYPTSVCYLYSGTN